MSDIGESSRAINARADEFSWPRVLTALKSGASIYRPARLKSFYTQCIDPTDKNHEIGISATMVKRLEKNGNILRCGIDRYVINCEIETTIQIKTAKANNDFAALNKEIKQLSLEM